LKNLADLAIIQKIINQVMLSIRHEYWLGFYWLGFWV